MSVRFRGSPAEGEVLYCRKMEMAETCLSPWACLLSAKNPLPQMTAIGLPYTAPPRPQPAITWDKTKCRLSKFSFLVSKMLPGNQLDTEINSSCLANTVRFPPSDYKTVTAARPTHVQLAFSSLERSQTKVPSGARGDCQGQGTQLYQPEHNQLPFGFDFCL